MSSLAVHAGPGQFDFARSQESAGRCSENRAHNPTSANDTSVPSWFQGGLPTPPASKDMTGISLSNNYGSYSQQQAYSNGYSNPQIAQPFRSHSRHPSESQNVGRSQTAGLNISLDLASTEKSRANAIASHLQIPESVNKSKGSLAEFAAEITCLFWFESAATLKYAETLPADVNTDRGLVPDATPALGFRKWVTTILSTTQVGKNVILLALMFIYRLKKFNPSVSGKRGSEFRLLTIALMLGNKFLDDNTYTNKTWAEVSGISVGEIHIMEVEFLSNMKYELYASEADWVRWKTLLGKFGVFYEKALNFQQRQDEQRLNPPITPTSQMFGYKLPSPPSGHVSSMHTPNYTALPNPLTNLPHLPKSPDKRYMQSGVPSERKRSIDPTEGLPPAKRPQYSVPSSNNVSPVALQPNTNTLLEQNAGTVGASPFGPFNGVRVPQLPMPRIPTTTAGMGTHLAPLALPTAKAMTSVYPVPPSTWSQPVTPISAVPSAVNNQYHSDLTPVTDVVRNQLGPDSARTSPVNMFGSVTPTRPGLSPSYFLTNRSSPYRPVRHVNTLLIPPPSAAMQTPVRNVGYEQMHYQPLGRPLERHAGTVPFYQSDAWAQSNASTPTASTYRPF